MRTSIVLVALLISMTVYSQQKRDLKFLSASPDMVYDYQNYLTMLYKLNGDSLQILDTLSSGKKMMARFIGNAKSQGSIFIYEESYNNLDDNNLILLNTNNITSKSKMKLPKSINPWPNLILKDGEIVYCLMEDLSGSEINYFGYDKELNLVEVYPDDFKKIYLNGNPGAPIKIDEKLLAYSNSIDGKLYIPVTKEVTKRPVFPIQLSEEYYPNEKKRLAIHINNEDCFVIKLDNIEGENSTFLVLDKVTNQWDKLVLKGDRTRVQYFSNWISGSVINHGEDKVSPGKADRRQEPNSFGPGFDTMTKVLKFYYPGLLFLYHTSSKTYIEWSTDQGDSEVLLVDGDLVYYRVNDEIYQAAILKSKKLGKSKLLLKDDRVPDIHWAFFGSK
ncbi:MAG: hypothetical protein RLO81_14125 [Fulvivirga sp.]|uniref:hypothetical protein n=1 Tax=Fulvivirga sp. TaxID=1931237 RepID=UPI0032ED1811